MEAYRKQIPDLVSAATGSLHESDLCFKALEAVEGGPAMTAEDKKCLAVVARMKGLKAEAMLSSPARKVAEIVAEKTGLPQLDEMKIRRS